MGRRLYVGNLAWTVTDQDLLDVFSEAGSGGAGGGGGGGERRGGRDH